MKCPSCSAEFEPTESNLPGGAQKCPSCGKFVLDLGNVDGAAVQNSGNLVVLYEKLASQGNASAQYNLAMLYKSGTDEIEQDEETAAKLFMESAEKGFAPAQYEAARMY